jgi:hypothetical protein
MATTWATAGDMGNKGATLYVPGQSKMGAGDTFLGGTGTGISDAQLNGAQRIYGNTAQDTANAYKNYQGDQAQLQTQADSKANIEALKQAQISANIASLGKSRDQSLSNLSAEKATIAPEYYAKRNTESTQSLLGAKNFAEFLANRGQTNSGLAGQGQIASDVALQGGLGALNQQELGANTDIARRTTDVGNAYNSDVASANAGAEATALQNTITQMNADRAFNQNTDQFNKNYGLQEAGLTGTFNGQKTFAAQQADLQAAQFQQQFGLSVGEAIGNYQGNPTLAAKAQTIQQAQFAASQAQDTSQFDQNLALQKAQLALSASKASSGGGSSAPKGPTAAQQAASAKLNTQAATADAFSRLNELANQGQTRDQIITAYDNNYSNFSNGGADMDALYKAIDASFKWNG